MTTATTTPAPIRADERIDMLDVMRGVAICGILLMNVQGMGTLDNYGQPVLPARWDANWIAWGVQNLLFEGTMRGLFTMLFGAGMLVMLRRAEGADPHVAPFDVWTRRCLALMALGVVQWAVFLWPGEILWCYGVTGLFLLAFRTARPKTLVIASTVLMLAMCGWFGGQTVQKYAGLNLAATATHLKAQGKPLDKDQAAALEKVEEKRAALRPSAQDLAKGRAERTHWRSLIVWSWGEWSPYNIASEQWLGLIESGCFMLIGMALLRTGILTGAGSAGLYRSMIFAGYGGGLAIRLGSMAIRARTGFDIDLASISLPEMLARSILYEPGRMLVTLGHVGLIATVWRSGLIGRAWPVRAMGRMALTVYSLESILTSVLFYGFGYVGLLGFAALIGVAVAIWILCGAFCLWWLKRYEMGPAERLLRTIAYGRARNRVAVRAASAAVPAV